MIEESNDITSSNRKFTAETNIRLQKAFVVSFSIMLFVVLSGDFLNDVASFVYNLSDADSEHNRKILQEERRKQIIIFSQYIMIYVVFQYSFNYYFASITYFTRYNKTKIIMSGGLFVLGKIIIDWILPVGLAMYVLFKINESCDQCMMSDESEISKDFINFREWLQLFYEDKKSGLLYIFQPIIDLYAEHILPVFRMLFDIALMLVGSFVDFSRDWLLENLIPETPRPPQLEVPYEGYCYESDEICFT